MKNLKVSQSHKQDEEKPLPGILTDYIPSRFLRGKKPLLGHAKQSGGIDIYRRPQKGVELLQDQINLARIYDCKLSG